MTKGTPPFSELTLSRSQIMDYLGCGYRWDATYRRGIQPYFVREKMDGGSAVHRGIEEAIRRYTKTGKTDPKKELIAILDGISKWKTGELKRLGGKNAPDNVRAELNVLQEEGVVIARRALAHFGLNQYEVATYKGKPVFEMEFLLKLPPWRGFRVIPDLLAREKGGPKGAGWWIIDWKTVSQFLSDDAEEINLQFSTIQKALGHGNLGKDGFDVEGSKRWQIKGVAPAWPTRNKNGEMSRAKISTDWETYRAALLEAKLDPAEYIEEMQPKLEEIQWFKILKQHRTDEECEQVWNKIVVPVSAAIVEHPQIIRRWNHMAMVCQACWLRPFCMTELKDGDTDFLLETDFIDTRNPRPRREMGDGTTFTMRD